MDIWDELVVQLVTVPDLPGAAAAADGNCSTLVSRNMQTPTTHARPRRNSAEVCPALHCCTAWIDSLPAHQRPVGVVAGRYITVAEAVNAQKGRVS